MMITGYFFQTEKKIFVQDIPSILKIYERQGYRVKSTKGGKCEMFRPLKAEIQFEKKGGQVFRQNVKHLIAQYYGVKQVTWKEVQAFFQACSTNEIELKYNPRGFISF